MEPPTDAFGPVEVDVDDTVLRLALVRLTGQATVASVAGAPPVRVSDRIETCPDVLIVAPLPLACREAVQALLERRVRAAVCADEPDELPVVLGALRRRLCALPNRILELASVVPALTARQRAVVAGIVEGNGTQALAVGLGVSAATVKREVRTVLAAVRAPGRVGIATWAHGLDV